MRKAAFIALSSIVVLLLFTVSGCSVAGPTATGTNSGASTENPSTSQTSSTLLRIVAAPALAASDSTLDYQPPPLQSPPQFSNITQSLVFGGESPGTNIPSGSTVYHWKNKITEVVGPDNSILFIVKDTDVAQIPTPGGGPQPATHVLGVPNGAHISQDPNNKNVTRIYNGGKQIGTIVTKPEDFPYTPTQIRNSVQQYVATGLYSDGSAGNITSKVLWQSSNPSVASISDTGLVTALSNGTTNITASLSGMTSVPVELTVHRFASISISDWSGIGAPRSLTSLPIGYTWNLYAKGTYSDGSTADVTKDVTWTSSNTDVATIGSSGKITGISDGADNITASLYGITSLPISFTVVSLSSIEVMPPKQLKLGSGIWISAQGVYSDGSTNGVNFPVTWNSSDPSVATVSSDGLLKAVSEGSTNITASANGMISKPATVTVISKIPNQ